MKVWLVRLGLVCALATSSRAIAADPATAKEVPRQVLLEFVVLEVAGGSSKPLELPSGGALSNAPDQLSGFSYAAGTSADLGSTVAALARDARVKIVNRPRIQTSHDTPATLFVGEVAGKKPSEDPGSEPLMIGLTLSVNPLIHSNGLITLDLRMKQVNRDGKTRMKAGLVPIITTREAQTRLALHDRETIMMAGLAAPTSATALRSPKDTPDATAKSSSRSTSGQTVLLVRATLVAG